MSDRTLEGLPWWAKRLDELSGHFSRQGLGGLLDHHRVTNALGEAIAIGGVTPEELLVWIQAQVASRMSVGPSPDSALQDPWAAYNADPRAFWEQVWEEILGRKIEIPPVPKLKGKTKKAIERYKLMLVFLPKITEDDYPGSFIKPAWGRYIGEASIERRPLPGRWVLAEMIDKPNWDDQSGYKDDLLGQDLGLTTRFKISWDHLTASLLPKAAKLLGLAKPSVRQPTLEERNLTANLFNWLREHRGLDLPDLDSTNSWEWCLNVYASSNRLFTGHRDRGGLSSVNGFWSGDENDHITFRVLAVL